MVIPFKLKQNKTRLYNTTLVKYAIIPANKNNYIPVKYIHK